MGRYISTTGTANVVTTTVTSAFAADANYRVLADTTAGGFTVTLPIDPLVGDQIQIIDVANKFATGNLTVARNGKLINGLAENLILDVNGALTTLLYTGLTYGWVITSA